VPEDTRIAKFADLVGVLRRRIEQDRIALIIGGPSEAIIKAVGDRL
jgi:hypothetical protein